MKKTKKKARATATTAASATTAQPTARQKAIREITSSVLDSCVSGGGVRSQCPNKKARSLE